MPKMQNVHAQEASRFAWWSIFCSLASPWALYHGVKAIQEIGASNGTQSGSGRAWFGTIVGGFYVMLWVLLVLTLLGQAGR